jgi:hypothetical protein
MVRSGTPAVYSCSMMKNTRLPASKEPLMTAMARPLRLGYTFATGGGGGEEEEEEGEGGGGRVGP